MKQRVGRPADPGPRRRRTRRSNVSKRRTAPPAMLRGTPRPARAKCVLLGTHHLPFLRRKRSKKERQRIRLAAGNFGARFVPSVSRTHSVICSLRSTTVSSARCRFSEISHRRAAVRFGERLAGPAVIVEFTTVKSGITRAHGRAVAVRVSRDEMNTNISPAAATPDVNRHGHAPQKPLRPRPFG